MLAAPEKNALPPGDDIEPTVRVVPTKLDEVDQLMLDRGAIERLLIEHRMLKEAIENSPVAYCVYDTDDRLIARNQTYAGLYPALSELERQMPANAQPRYGDLIRSLLEGHVPPEQLEAAIEERVEAQKNADGKPTERDYGTKGIFRVMKYPLPSGAIAGMAFEITELKAREAELEDARRRAVASEQSKAAFLANMSHELRTPLNAIIGFSELLMMRLASKDMPKEMEYLGDIADSGKHLVSLINDLLDLSRIETQAQTLNESQVSVAEVLTAAHALLLPVARQEGVELELIDLPPGLYVQADERALKQILLNFAGNGLRYTQRGGRVTIGGKFNASRQVEISVTDNGPGIPIDELEQIHEPFVRGVAQVKAASQGAGLGLSITKALIELHEGEFRLESSVGEGTCATVILPAKRTVSIAGIAVSRGST